MKKPTVVSYDTNSPTITEREYRAFQVAYDFSTRSYSAVPCPMCL